MHIERPETMAEALIALERVGAKALAGGTNVMVDIKKGREQAEYLVSLDALDALKKIERKVDGIHIGSLVTFTMLEEFLETVVEKDAKEVLKALKEAVSTVGGPQIRNRGTVGGNILCASPSSDSVPALLVLDASLKLISRAGGVRIVPLEGFVTGVRQTEIKDGELLLEIIVPIKKGKSCFYKAGTRNAMAISVVDEALYLYVESVKETAAKASSNGDGGKRVSCVIKEAAIALGSVAPTVVRAPKTEALLLGKTTEDIFDSDYMNLIRETLAEEISPITDLRGEKDYRQIIAQNILEENLKTLLGGH